MEIPIFRFALEVLIMETIKDYVAHLDKKKELLLEELLIITTM